jgi:hypothetical protein
MAERLRRLPRKQIPSGALVQIQLTAKKYVFLLLIISPYGLIQVPHGNLRADFYLCSDLRAVDSLRQQGAAEASRGSQSAAGSALPAPLAPARPITAGLSLLPDAKLFPSFSSAQRSVRSPPSCGSCALNSLLSVPRLDPNPATRI